MARAFDWQSKGQEFDSPNLHKKLPQGGFFCWICWGKILFNRRGRKGVNPEVAEEGTQRGTELAQRDTEHLCGLFSFHYFYKYCIRPVSEPGVFTRYLTHK